MDPFVQPFVLGRLAVAGRELPRVGTAWSTAERLGAAKVRWGIGRYDYRVAPGLYAVGTPTPDAPVLVTANYKLSFDVLRRELAGRDVFLLVLETMGINVWCAAGKGTFGTEELCQRVEAAGLLEVVSHRRLVLPQLGAPGVAAHEVRRRTGFRVVYGPVEARDLPRFLEGGRKATPEMRRKRFPWRERAALVPMELVPAAKIAVPAMAFLALLGALLGPGPGFWDRLAGPGLLAALAVVTGVLCGAVLASLLLPLLPGRAFATKGAVVGLAVGLPAVVGWAALLGVSPEARWIDLAGLAGAGAALASFLAMNFTGSSTFTSLSGVEREMRVAVPAQAVVGVLGLLAWGLSVALWR